ncbi:uncharacterized protein N7483_011856 [Penicillium malachiteum]|uniref:uncharacterized protein n=1 Tax=Penicillium malachiteum TaxID=1324776 RepID=UPI002547D614|nr:uncharacterized protein N7483_011856 [Penicillium malachiteum]KAJ5714675.1 hypothetical protein N7483_011856 [Penicillium malachiteum]
MDSQISDQKDYNAIIPIITRSVENALNTFGPDSNQYQTVLQILKDFVRDIEKGKLEGTVNDQSLDPDMLSAAMGLLEIK